MATWPRGLLLLMLGWVSPGVIPAAPDSRLTPIIVGAMKEAMWDGRLEGRIDLDTIADKEGLVGLGPIEYLRGEIMLLDGKGYASEITPEGNIKVTRTTKVKAPFFAYGRVKKWKREALPDTVTTLKEIEDYFLGKKGMGSGPTLFRIEAVAQRGALHVVNLPPGTKVRSPREAHRGKRHFPFENRELVLLGFFSTEHQSIFTHHDSYLHIHALTTNHDLMGHLDEILLAPGKAWVSTPER